MSNYLRNNVDATRETTSPFRRSRLWLATGVVGLTGAVSLAGVAYATTGAVGPHRVTDVKWSTAQLKDDAGRGGDRDAREAKEAKDRYDAKDEHGRVREVPCDDDKLVEALDLANRDHGGTIKLAEHCTYELDFADKKSGGALPTIKQEITIKGNDATIKRDSEDAFRLFRVADGGDLTLKDLTLKDGNAAEFKYGQVPGGPGGYGGSGASAVPGVQTPATAQGAAMTQQAPQVALAAVAGAAVVGAPVGTGALADGAGPQLPKPPSKEGEGDGGALLVERGGSAHLEKVKLIGNNAEHNGGAIANFGRVEIEDSKVENNHARENGGGIFNVGLLRIEDTKIVNNTAGENGGGVANGRGKKDDKDALSLAPSWKDRDKAGSVDIIDSAVDGNNAGHNGGGVFSSGGYVKIVGEEKDHDKKYDEGAQGRDYGKKYDEEAQGGDYGKKYDEDAQGRDHGKKYEDEAEKKDEHKAEDKDKDKGKPEEKGKPENKDGDKGQGGTGAGDFGGDYGREHHEHATVKDNTACENGGGIYAHNTDLVVEHVLVAKNHASKDGGGIYNTGGEKREAIESLPGDGREGEHEANATVADSAIVDNTAGRFGGGIFNGEAGLKKVEDGYQEWVEGKGDAAFLTLRDTVIKGNTALNGGGIFNNEGTVHLNDTKVVKNTATDASKLHRIAGGILNHKGHVRLDDESTVTDNDPTNCAGTVEDCFN
ncbi:hypothetical protein [Micromonospora siamensis]|uniref:Polymorphic outer membrane protein repeat-containing protein n=1 Tax=Micromonospora siamensis TaxID=299152 RepID=A0A1C5JD40_9ACTN|nr:hypothetical protein [Micromonospora siamensis]SCG67946.1 polymorphic outer membrane protein repeat-containing protein [Micromonospora siamensis]